MKKLRYIALTMLSALTLTSCSLFSDVDIEINNKFNPKGHSTTIVTTTDHIGDVYGVKCSDVPNTTVFKSVVYSNLPGNKIENTYETKLGATYNVNKGEDYPVNKDNNNFDLYVPNGLDKTAEHNVALFIHGGAWISGLKTQVNPYVKRFAKEGYIAATIEYTLLNKDIIDSSASDKEAKYSSLSIFRDLDEIDACITTMKNGLGELGFDVSKLNLVLGGGSSGAHLAMLYAYSRGEESDMPIKFLIDAVGPTDIKESVWKAFKYTSDSEHEQELTDGIDKNHISDSNTKELPVAGQGYNWNTYQTMRIANGMCGMPYSINDVEATTSDKIHVSPGTVYTNLVSKEGSGYSGSGQDLLSVTHWMSNSNVIPMICAYSGKDSVVGVKQYANLQKKLDSLTGSEYEFIYFRDCDHTNLDSDSVHYNEFVNTILDWMATK